MIKSLFRRARRQGTIDALYGMIVAQARSPGFYRDFGVPDTVNGRFDMVLLHLWLFLHRLRAEPGEEPRLLGQGTFNAFCADMDAHLREVGTGDLKVPKEMRKVGEAFYGRVQAYDAGLAQDDEALARAIGRNIFADETATGARRLATYVREAVTALAAQNVASLAEGRLRFPDVTMTTNESAA